MATTELLAPPTNEELLLRDDGIERSIIRGELREKPMTRRNRIHSQVMAQLARFLYNWVDQQPEPRGAVLCGEAGCLLSHDPETLVGIDVAYISPELAAYNPEHTTLIDGVPTLVVEILSPSDVEEEVNEKLDLYLEVGVPVVWVVDAHFKTVTIHRPKQEPILVNRTQELSAEPELPGFRVPVAELFR